MVESLRPDAAYMLERNGRHDVVMRGGVDPAEAIGLTDAIGRRHGTPVGCMTLRSAALLRDPSGNDAKLVAARGVALAGDMSVGGPVRAPRPADVAAARMVWNLDRLGFPMCVREEPGPQPVLRPEYVVAASQFHREARWFLSGTAVLLRRPDIDWDLMTYLARTYRFVGLARGILEALEGIDGGRRVPGAAVHAGGRPSRSERGGPARGAALLRAERPLAGPSGCYGQTRLILGEFVRRVISGTGAWGPARMGRRGKPCRGRPRPLLLHGIPGGRPTSA